MSKRAAFFDLDKTLLPGSSLFLMARGLYERDFYRVRDILKLGWEQFKFWFMGEAEQGIEVARETALNFVKGHTQDAIKQMGREIAEEEILPQVYQEIIQVIENHKSKGHLTYLTTASPQELADIIADSLDMTGALGTQAELDEQNRYTGRLNGSLLHGEAKADAVRKLAEDQDIDLEESFAYSDSTSDLPLLELVGHPQIVNPDSELKSIAQEKGWPMYELRTKRLALLIGIPVGLGGITLFAGGLGLGFWLGLRSGRENS